MSSEETEHFLRLWTLLIEGPTKTLLEFVLIKACCTFSKLDNYLNSYQSVLQNKIPRYQYDQLFKPGTKLEKHFFDISLSCILLTRLFNCSSQEKQWITAIKDIRNDLCHRSDSIGIDKTVFKNMWQDIMDATKGLAGQISPSYLQEMTDTIEDVKQRSLPPPGPYKEILKDVLSTMNGTIFELNGTINELRDDMKTLTKSSEKGTSILEKVVYVHTRKGEPATKRIKILHPNLEKMQDSFKKTMGTIPDDFTANTDSEEMYTKLNESRRLYVAGPHSSMYLHTALYVIKWICKDIKDIKTCVEMTDCSDWNHVNSDDVSLVLFRDPFGIKHISNERIRRTHDCLDTIDEEIGGMPLEKRMFVIITSDYNVHLQYMHTCYQEPHDILTDVVLFQKPTTEEDPHVVIDERHSLNHGTDTCSELTTLQEHTKTFVDFYARQGLPAQRFEDAKKILKQHKMLAINGPRNSGKTSLAAKLMALLYTSDRCVLLQRPYDMRCIRFGDVSIVLVEDFAGKFEPNKQTAVEWYNVFDVLLPAVLSGKLSVIIVSEVECFRRCQLPTHGLLRYDITLAELEQPVIKPECGLDFATGDAYMMANASTSRIGQRKSLLNATFEHKTTFSATTKDGLIVQACTIMPSGHCIIAYGQSVVLVDINFKLMSEEDVSDISGIATVNDRNVIITRGDQYLQYIHVNLSASPPSLTLGHRIDVGENVMCKGIDVNDSDIYVLCINLGCRKPEIRVLNKGSGVLHNTISLDISVLTYCLNTGFKVSPNGDRVYVFDVKSFKCISTRGDIVYEYSLPYATSGGMYVDNEDNLLVCSDWSNNIHLIDKDGRDVKVVLNESDGISLPIFLCYREIDSCLVVVCGKRAILTIKVKW